MEAPVLSNVSIKPVDWYSEEFIYTSVVNFLKENGYKVHKESSQKETEKAERTITASKFFKKEVIEVKGFPYSIHPAVRESAVSKGTHAKSWFTEALFNSFANFSVSDNAEVAMALPNVARYQAIIKKLNSYFSVNDLYFKIYLVDEDGSVKVSNLNDKYANAATF